VTKTLSFIAGMYHMLPFENMVADYINETGNHVLYRVTPIFDGNNLVASGVLMEAESVEDNGEGICFCVFCYNVQPDVTIDYATGDSALSEGNTSGTTATETPKTVSEDSSSEESIEQTYILNTNTHKFHDPSCSCVDDIKDSNKETYTGSRDDLITRGYEPCGQCKP
jgi:DNA-entry nuclease